MKTCFELEQFNHNNRDPVSDGCIHIIGNEPDHSPYVFIKSENYEGFIPDRSIKLFARNLFKSLFPEEYKKLKH